jgi:hypothetical protein
MAVGKPMSNEAPAFNYIIDSLQKGTSVPRE